MEETNATTTQTLVNAAKRLVDELPEGTPADKVSRLRIFDGEDGRMDRSLVDLGAAALCISQFTLYGDTRRGLRPSFTAAAEPERAERLYEEFCDALAARGVHVERGRFGARMSVALVNEGPVTLLLEI